MVYPYRNYWIPEYPNTPSGPETGPHDVRLQTFPRSDKNLEKFFLKHLTTRFWGCIFALVIRKTTQKLITQYLQPKL